MLKLEKDHDGEETPLSITIVPKDQAPRPIFSAGCQKGPSALYPEFQVSATEELWLEASLARAAKVTLFQRSEGVFSGDLSEQL